MAGIYLHIPFCKQACHYCDFHFSTSLRYQGPMVGALQQELTLRRPYLGDAGVQTVYYGGGTPSLLAPKEVATLQAHIQATFSCAPAMEVTLELNPDDATPAKLEGLRRAGVNRLSMGIQSFDDGLLRSLNRAHCASEAVASVRMARQAGFDNLSLDLMYGLPQGDDARWQADLDCAVGLAPEHLATYCLTIEGATLFGRWQRQGRLKAVSQEVAARQYQMMVATLTTAGYLHYEISNLCLPGYEAQHNSNYWHRVPYLGVGPGAHSFDGYSRQYNVRHNRQYLEAIGAGGVPCRREELTLRDHVNEYLMTSLRTMWGCDLAYLRTAHGYDLLQEQGEAVATLETQGLLHHQGDCLTLTAQGKLVADGVAAQLWLA